MLHAKRSPALLLAAAALLPIGLGAAGGLFPDAADVLMAAPWAGALAVAASVVLPLALYFLAFRDLLAGSSERARKVMLAFLIPAVFFFGVVAVILALEFGRGASRLGAFVLWSLLCVFAMPLSRTLWDGVQAVSPRVVMASGGALLAWALSLGAALGSHTYAETVSRTAAVCRVVAAAEAARLERDQPRWPELEADVASCADPRFLLGLASRRRPVLPPSTMPAVFVGGCPVCD